jgi:hypothetical protein
VLTQGIVTVAVKLRKRKQTGLVQTTIADEECQLLNIQGRGYMTAIR